MKIFTKLIMYFFIVLGTIVVGFLGYYFISVSGQIVEVTRKEIVLEKLDEIGFNRDIMKSAGFSDELVRDFEKDPEKFRWIVFVTELNNRSNVAQVVDIKFKSQLPEDLQKRVVWIDEESVANYLEPSEKRGEGVAAILKLEEGDTEQKILDMAKKARITITGRKMGFLFNHGTFSITVTYSGNGT